jgi:hypothetical protein
VGTLPVLPVQLPLHAAELAPEETRFASRRQERGLDLRPSLPRCPPSLPPPSGPQADPGDLPPRGPSAQTTARPHTHTGTSGEGRSSAWARNQIFLPSCLPPCTAIAHLAPTMGPGGVPGSYPPQKEPNERGDRVFVCCAVYGVNEAPFGHPHPQARQKKPLNRAIAALVLPPPSLFWPPSAGERAPP